MHNLNMYNTIRTFYAHRKKMTKEIENLRVAVYSMTRLDEHSYDKSKF